MTALVGGISLLVLLAVGLVLVVNWSVGARNTNDLLADKSVLLVRGLEDPVRGVLEPVRRQIDAIGQLVEAGRVSSDDVEALTRVMTGALAATPQATAILFVTPDLREITVGRDEAGLPSVTTRDASTNAQLRDALTEARTRAARGSYWWDPVFVSRSRTTVASVHRPIHIDGRFAGLMIAGVSMQELSRRAAETSAREGVTTFLESGDKILAHPRLAEAHPDLGPDEPTVAPDRLGDPVVAAMARAHPVPGLDKTKADGVTVSMADAVDGQSYVYFEKPLHGFGRQRLSVVAYVPLNVVDRELMRLTWSGLVGLAVLAIAVLIAVILGRGIGRPIREMAESAQAITSLEFADARPMRSSPIRELSDQAKAFNAMLSALRWFELYVPRRLVRRLMAEGEPSAPFANRTIAVLFADIIDYTQMTETWTPERVATMLNGHFALLAGPIEDEDGIIDKYMGDCLMAFWVEGVSDDGPGVARRAARAAAAIGAALEAENRRRRAAGEIPIRVRIGLHVGEAMVGNIGAPGRINFTVVGRTVNVAQRLERLARETDDGEADSVVAMSAAVAAALEPDSVERIGRRQVHGIRHHVEVFTFRRPAAPPVAQRATA
jgi:adenylate cyclase